MSRARSARFHHHSEALQIARQDGCGGARSRYRLSTLWPPKYARQSAVLDGSTKSSPIAEDQSDEHLTGRDLI